MKKEINGKIILYVLGVFVFCMISVTILFLLTLPQILSACIETEAVTKTEFQNTLSPILAIPLVLILAGIFIPKIRKKSIAVLFCGFALTTMLDPVVQIIKCQNLSSNAEILERVSAASGSLAICYILFSILAFVIVTQLLNNRKKSKRTKSSS